MNWEVKLNIFEGPLDLLIHLVKENELNIYDIPISVITKQYFEYLELMKMLDINIAGEFIEMASRLLRIKARMLLPAQEEEGDEADPRRELIDQIVEYKLYKEVARQLKEKSIKQRDYIAKNEIYLEGDISKGIISYNEAGMFDLLKAFKNVIESIGKKLPDTIEGEVFTVEEKAGEIKEMLKESSYIKMNDIFFLTKSRLEIVTYFLAVLELIKAAHIKAVQPEGTEEILIERGENYGEIKILTEEQSDDIES